MLSAASCIIGIIIIRVRIRHIRTDYILVKLVEFAFIEIFVECIGDSLVFFV